MLARSLCYYRLFDLRDTPATRRDAGLQIQLRQWMPFQNGDSYIVWRKGFAQVWVWDRQLQQQAMQTAQVKYAPALPETLLQAPQADGVHIQSCVEGYDAQVWKQGVLHSSRWWASLPGAAQWQTFLRAHGLPPDTELPAALERQYLPAPWAKPNQALSGGLNMLRRESTWVYVGLAMLGLVAVWEGIALWKTQQSLQQVQERREALSDKATPILTARNQALNYQRQIADLLMLNIFPSQLELLSIVAEKLPEDAKVVQWEYQPGLLSLIIEGENLDPKAYAERFQPVKQFLDVSVRSGRKPKQLQIDAFLNQDRSN